MTIGRTLLCVTLLGALAATLPTANAVNSLDAFFCDSGIDHDYCAHDLADAQVCPQVHGDYGKHHFATHFPSEIARCKASNLAACAAGHGPKVCHKGSLSTPAITDITPPVRPATAAYTEAQSRTHLIDTLANLGSAAANAAGFNVASSVLSLVSYFDGSFGTSGVAQCAHGMVPLSNGQCLDWQLAMQRITKYVSDYVNYKFDVERTTELKQLLTFVYKKWDEVSGYTANSELQIGAAQILSDHMDEHVQDWKNWINLPDTDFVNSLIVGGHTHKMVNGNLVAHVTTEQDAVENWALASAFPHYADMHLTVKMVLLTHALKTGDKQNIYNLAALQGEGGPGPNGIVHDRSFTIRTMVQKYFAMKSQLQWKLHKVRLEHITARWENSYDVGRCYNTQDGHIENCVKNVFNQPHSSDRLSMLVVVEDTWPACKWKVETTNRFLAYDATSANCKGLAWCDDPQHPDHASAGHCQYEHQHWVMSHWDTFWTNQFAPHEQKWNMIDNKMRDILNRLDLPHPVRHMPTVVHHSSQVSRIPTDPAIANGAPENLFTKPASCNCDPNSNVPPTDQCMNYCMTHGPSGYAQTSRRLAMPVQNSPSPAGRLRGARH